MTEEIKNAHLSLLLICLCLLISCKLDSNKTESTEKETVHSSSTIMEKPDTPLVSQNLSQKDVSDTILETNTTEIITPPEEIKEETLPDKKAIKEPAQIKPPSASNEKNKVLPIKKAQIKFEELTWDFGEITEGDIIEKKFKFTNIGDVPLEIIATSATCGCTRPSFPFLDIAPGESNVIGVNYNSVGKEGEQNPEVTVESNAEPKITTIKLHGTVKPKSKKEAHPVSATAIKDTVAMKQ